MFNTTNEERSKKQGHSEVAFYTLSVGTQNKSASVNTGKDMEPWHLPSTASGLNLGTVSLGNTWALSLEVRYLCILSPLQFFNYGSVPERNACTRTTECQRSPLPKAGPENRPMCFTWAVGCSATVCSHRRILFCNQTANANSMGIYGCILATYY